MKATIEIIQLEPQLKAGYAIVRCRNRSPLRESQYPIDVRLTADEMRGLAVRLQKAADDLEGVKTFPLCARCIGTLDEWTKEVLDETE